MANADLDKQPDSVSSVLKVFGILQALGEEREIGITELSQRVMMSKSTVYRFLQTMKTLGYVAQEGESEKYSLTLKLFELGDRDEVKQILEGVEYKRSTERTITSTEALLPVLDQVREQGYGEDNEEQEEGLRCIAVPVFDRFGVVIAGLSISFPTLRFSEERLQEYVAMLHTAARKISAQMGYHDYPF
ncbi:TPA: helix-turn-helix domain-containing protein [Escherichia coli]|nr:helix-turn-helix domain-containing protein [Escherichia coli]